jgi:hypothetical protein
MIEFLESLRKHPDLNDAKIYNQALDDIKTHLLTIPHYQCNICGGNPNAFPYKPDIFWTGNGRIKTPPKPEAKDG